MNILLLCSISSSSIKLERETVVPEEKERRSERPTVVQVDEEVSNALGHLVLQLRQIVLQQQQQQK